MTRSHDLKHQDIEALLPGYVVGALDTEETLAVETYIHQQRALLDRLERLEHKASQLTHVTQPIAPPPNVRRAVMMIARLDAPAEGGSSVSTYKIPSAIQTFEQNGHNGHNGTPGFPFNNGNASQGAATTYAIMPYRPQSVVRSTPRVANVIRQRRLTLRLWQMAAVSALVALLVMAAIGLLLNQQLGQTLEQGNLKDSKFDTLLATNNQLLVEKESLQSEQQSLRTQNQAMGAEQQLLAQQMSEVQHQIQVMSGADLVRKLRAPNGTSEANLYLTGNVAALMATGLPVLPADKTFQLWSIDSTGRSIPVAVFTTQAEESKVWREFSLSQSTADIQAVAISIEALGGSVTPSAYILQSTR